MAKLKTSLGETFYIKKGRAGKTPIISCHGGPGGTHLSVKPMLELATNRQIAVFDQIGTGQSSQITKKQMAIATFCKNLNELADHLGYKEFILHGSSWGGTLILEYFKRHPKKVKGLIFHSSLISSKVWVQDAKKLIAKLPKKEREIINSCEKIGATDSKVYKAAMMVFYKKHICRDPEAYKKPKTPSKSKSNEEMYEHMWGPSEFCPTGTLKKYEGRPILKKINVPTLFISGQYDEATPRASASFARQVKNARFVEIKGASHSSLREKKEETFKVITKFLKNNNL